MANRTLQQKEALRESSNSNQRLQYIHIHNIAKARERTKSHTSSSSHRTHAPEGLYGERQIESVCEREPDREGERQSAHNRKLKVEPPVHQPPRRLSLTHAA